MSIYKTKSAKDISLVTFSVFAVGVFLWLIYGILIAEWPIILANAATLLLAIAIAIMKIVYK